MRKNRAENRKNDESRSIRFYVHSIVCPLKLFEFWHTSLMTAEAQGKYSGKILFKTCGVVDLRSSDALRRVSNNHTHRETKYVNAQQ